MPKEPIDETYFKWLYRQVASTRNKNPRRSYWELLLILYNTEFTSSVENDSNRLADGTELRTEFYNETGLDENYEWNVLGCSALELIIGVARRLSYNGGGAFVDRFWELMHNLTLSQYNDQEMETVGSHRRINLALRVLIDRTYDPSGAGGLFPLHSFVEDQTSIEIWEQMHYYIVERME